TEGTASTPSTSSARSPAAESVSDQRGEGVLVHDLDPEGLGLGPLGPGLLPRDQQIGVLRDGRADLAARRLDGLADALAVPALEGAGCHDGLAHQGAAARDGALRLDEVHAERFELVQVVAEAVQLA